VWGQLLIADWNASKTRTAAMLPAIFELVHSLMSIQEHAVRQGKGINPTRRLTTVMNESTTSLSLQKQRPTRTTYSSELGEIPLGGVMLLSQMQMPPSLCSLPSIWYIFALETICDVDEKDTFLQLLPIPAVSTSSK